MLQDWFWATTLSKDTREHKWMPTFAEVDESCASVDLQEGHNKTLQLSQLVVCPDAKPGEVQEVEVVTCDSRESLVTATLAVLVAGSVYQTTLAAEFPQVPATLRLKRGDGPVCLIGKEFVEKDIDSDEDVEEEELNEEVEEEVDYEAAPQRVDPKKRKKPESNGKQAANGTGKGRKIKTDTKASGTGQLSDDEDEEDDMEEDEPDESDEDYSEEEQPPVSKKARKGPVAAVPPPAKKPAQGSAKKAGFGKKTAGAAKKMPKSKA